MERHKLAERKRYDAAAARSLHAPPRTWGAAGAPAEFRAPYEDYERTIRDFARPGAVVLDIGAGEGAFSLAARGAGTTLVATDISPLALLVARERASAAGEQLHLVVADAELLPFRSSAVDLVTSAGVLYCLDLRTVATELRRVLRPDGAWVIVDSLNESPIYRLNRWLGFLLRRRTQLAVENVPTTATLLTLRESFANVQIRYHGVLTFLAPALRPLLGANRAGAFVAGADRWLGFMRRWAFKVVVIAQGRVPA